MECSQNYKLCVNGLFHYFIGVNRAGSYLIRRILQCEYGVGRTQCWTYIISVRPTPHFLNCHKPYVSSLVVFIFVVRNVLCIPSDIFYFSIDYCGNKKM